jgi:hypothetical protein
MVIHDALTEYFRYMSLWRAFVAVRYQTDIESVQASEGLAELSLWVRTLPSSDWRLQELAAMALRGGVFAPGAQADAWASKFRLDDPREDFDEFLTRFVHAVRDSVIEKAREAGLLS